MIILKLGPAFVIESTHNLIHIIDLDYYHQHIQNLTNSITIFEKLSTQNDTIQLSKMKLDNAKSKLNTLTPYKRRKRGLINGLGTVIKTITGNMDENDAKQINSQINELMTHKKTL